jgi:hypothetical protein
MRKKCNHAAECPNEYCPHRVEHEHMDECEIYCTQYDGKSACEPITDSRVRLNTPLLGFLSGLVE